jgi:hypothetical protein
MKVKVVISLFLLLILLSVNFGTSPLPGPYHKYFIDGYVLCDTLLDKSNFLIQVFGKSNEHQDTFKAITYTGLDFEAPTDLTETSGFYNLIINSPYFLDSIKVAIIQSQQEPIFSQTYFVSNDSGFPIVTRFREIRESQGCKSCSTQPVTVVSIERYEYYIRTTSVNFCN